MRTYPKSNTIVLVVTVLLIMSNNCYSQEEYIMGDYTTQAYRENEKDKPCHGRGSKACGDENLPLDTSLSLGLMCIGAICLMYYLRFFRKNKQKPQREDYSEYGEDYSEAIEFTKNYKTE